MFGSDWPKLRHPAWVTVLGFAAGVLVMCAGLRFKQGVSSYAFANLGFAALWFGWSLELGRRLRRQFHVALPRAEVRKSDDSP
jgi:hypothetical protein